MPVTKTAKRALRGSRRKEKINKTSFKPGLLHPCRNGGISFEPYPLGWTKTYREQIRFRDDYKCQLCGCSEIENIRKLCIHHKDYDKNNINSENLIALCMSCHSKTNFNKVSWIEKFKSF